MLGFHEVILGGRLDSFQGWGAGHQEDQALPHAPRVEGLESALIIHHACVWGHHENSSVRGFRMLLGRWTHHMPGGCHPPTPRGQKRLCLGPSIHCLHFFIWLFICIFCNIRHNKLENICKCSPEFCEPSQRITEPGAGVGCCGKLKLCTQVSVHFGNLLHATGTQSYSTDSG